jgi:hypothetical protein
MSGPVNVLYATHILRGGAYSSSISALGGFCRRKLKTVVAVRKSAEESRRELAGEGKRAVIIIGAGKRVETSRRELAGEEKRAVGRMMESGHQKLV